MYSVQIPKLGDLACWVVGLQSNCHHRQYETNTASKNGSGLSQDRKDQITFQYCDVSSSKQTHVTLVLDVQLEVGPNTTRVMKPQCKYRIVPNQLSTGGYGLGTDDIQHPLVPTLQFHQFWGGSLG